MRRISATLALVFTAACSGGSSPTGGEPEPAALRYTLRPEGVPAEGEVEWTVRRDGQAVRTGRVAGDDSAVVAFDGAGSYSVAWTPTVHMPGAAYTAGVQASGLGVAVSEGEVAARSVARYAAATGGIALRVTGVTAGGWIPYRVTRTDHGCCGAIASGTHYGGTTTELGALLPGTYEIVFDRGSMGYDGRVYTVEAMPQRVSVSVPASFVARPATVESRVATVYVRVLAEGLPVGTHANYTLSGPSGVIGAVVVGSEPTVGLVPGEYQITWQDATAGGGAQRFEPVERNWSMSLPGTTDIRTVTGVYRALAP